MGVQELPPHSPLVADREALRSPLFLVFLTNAIISVSKHRYAKARYAMVLYKGWVRGLLDTSQYQERGPVLSSHWPLPQVRPWQPWLCWVVYLPDHSWLDQVWTPSKPGQLALQVAVCGRIIQCGHFLLCGPDTRAREGMLLPLLRAWPLPVPVLLLATVFCPWFFRHPFIWLPPFLLMPVVFATCNLRALTNTGEVFASPARAMKYKIS